MARRRARYPGNVTDTDPVIRLWLLRILIALGGHREFVCSHGFNNDALAEILGLGHWIDPSPNDFDLKAVQGELRQLHQKAEKQWAKAPLPVFLRSNIRRLSELVGLSPTDCRVLEFAVSIQNERLLDDTADYLGQLSSVKAFHALSVILDLPEPEIRASLSAQGILARSGLVSVDRSGTSTLRGKLDLLSDGFADLMATSDADPMADAASTSSCMVRQAPGKANWHARWPTNWVANCLKSPAKMPMATWSMASAVCAPSVPHKASSRNVGRSSRSMKSRTFSMMVIVSLAARVRLKSARRGSTACSKKTRCRRCGSPIPCAGLIQPSSAASTWCSNCRYHRSSNASASCATTAAICLMPAPLSRIADAENLAPAVVAKATSVVRSIRDELGQTGAAAAFERLISNTLEAQGHRHLVRHDPSRLPEVYDPIFIHADADLNGVANGLCKVRSGRLCLYGPPGTGKTAYGRWLAQQLDAPLLVKRASDLMSPYVGENEQNIAQAFRQAAQDGALLLIDEVDSFLQDRRGAQRGWEVSLVNEMLTQMESFPGVFIASTNLMDGLDQAALRRFDLKVKFDFLRPEQAWNLLRRHCMQLGLPAPQPDLMSRLMRLERLTPGDFATALRQHRFRPFESPSALVSTLEAECTVKDGAKRSIGFL